MKSDEIVRPCDRHSNETATLMKHVTQMKTWKNGWLNFSENLRIALREISGTYWLICVSLAIVSRLTRIIRSIDPTVANFQVNDLDLWNPRRWKSQFPRRRKSGCMLLNLLYYTIEKCRFESPLWHCVFMEICLIFYSYYIVRTRYIYIYIYTPCWLCMFCKY